MLKLPPRVDHGGDFLRVRLDETNYEWVDQAGEVTYKRDEIIQPADSVFISLPTIVISSMTRLMIFLNGSAQPRSAFIPFNSTTLQGTQGVVLAGTLVAVLEVTVIKGREDVTLLAPSADINLLGLVISDFAKTLVFLGGSLQKSTNFIMISPAQIQGTQGVLPAGSEITVAEFI